MRQITKRAGRSIAAQAVAGLAVLVMAASAWAAGSVYVTNRGSNDVSQFAIGNAGLLAPLIPVTVAAGTDPLQITVSPDGKSAYVTNLGGGLGIPPGHTVSQYSINVATGALSPKAPSTVATGTSPTSIALTPDGKSAYVINEDDNSISQFNVDPPTGSLLPQSPSVATASLPFDIAVSPDGKSAYVTNDNGPSAVISQYNIDPMTGGLSPKSPATVLATGSVPFAIVVAPNGKSAYVTNLGGGISQYDIDSVTGSLSPKSPAIIATGFGPEGVALTPDGKNAYVSNGDNTISQYSIDALTGALAPKTPAIVAAEGTGGIAVSPDGKSVYVTNSDVGNIGQYNVDPSSGALSPKSPETVAAGSGDAGIAVGRFPVSPTSKAQCKDGGWRNFPQLKNQGDCVSFVETGK
jgi:DNA-binding beta-propeller fold protein YncE